MKRILVLLLIFTLTACGDNKEINQEPNNDNGNDIEEFDWSIDRFPELYEDAIEIELGTVYKDGVYGDFDYMYIDITEAGNYKFNVTHASIYTYIVVAEDREGGFSIMQKEPSDSFLRSRYFEVGRVYIKWYNNVSEASEDAYWEFSVSKID